MKKVVVGISGGVDSSVAALLLKEKGYEVVGITFVFIDDFDVTNAKKVCETLNIEHHIIDYREMFKKTIINSFINDYSSGITPNPCVRCNRDVKINLLYEKMLELNCDFIATGHYAKRIDGKLYKSYDLNKDQTYFLAQVKKEQLDRILFPLEGIDKEKVREIALNNNLITASLKDSTDVCFINSNFKKYISDNISSQKGNVVNVIDNKIIGTHEGLEFYTIGQRKGLNIGGSTDRMYVVGKNIKENILYVCLGDDSDYLISDSCLIENFNCLIDEKIDKCTAKFRYRQTEVDVELEWVDDINIIVKYPQGVKAVTPGQSCVLYNGDLCLGGGVIKEVRKNNQKLWYL